MRLLIEEGGAFINVTDRWGNTPFDEASRAGARPCAAYLERCIAQQRGSTDIHRQLCISKLEMCAGQQHARCLFEIMHGARQIISLLWSHCNDCKFPLRQGMSGGPCISNLETYIRSAFKR